MNFPAEATKANVKRSQSVQNSEGVISEKQSAVPTGERARGQAVSRVRGRGEGKKKKNVMGFKQTCEIGPLNMESPG